MPVTIGIFITPGIIKTADPSNALNRFNRKFSLMVWEMHMLIFYCRKFYRKWKNNMPQMAGRSTSQKKAMTGRLRHVVFAVKFPAIKNVPIYRTL